MVSSIANAPTNVFALARRLVSATIQTRAKNKNEAITLPMIAKSKGLPVPSSFRTRTRVRSVHRVTTKLLKKITSSIPGKLRRAVREPANAVYAERASRNEHPPHRVSRSLASTRVRRALFEIIAAVFPLDNIFRRARLVGRKNSRDPSRHGVEAASRIFASAPLCFARPRDLSSLLQ